MPWRVGTWLTTGVTALSGQDAVTAGWFLAGLDAGVRDQLVALAQERGYPAGAVLFSEDDDTPFLGVVLDGRVSLRTRLPGRGTTTLLTVESGDVVGWSAVTHPHDATASVVAISDVRILCVDAARLRRELRLDPVFAAAVELRLLDALARRLAAHRLQLLDVYAAEPAPLHDAGAVGEGAG